MSKFKVGDEVRLVDGARNIVNNLGDGNIYVVEDIKEDGIKLRGLFPYYHFSLFEIVEILKESNTKKFKVGDEVTLKEDINSIYLKHNKEYIVDKVFYDKLFVQGVDFKYDSNIFELVKEKKMNKFKVGDKVVRVSETYGKAIKGGVYEVSGVSDNEWAGSCGINLKGHDCVIGKFKYESSCFDLYGDNILSPLEAAEALLKGEELEVIISKSEEWQSLGKHQNSVTVKNLKRWKFRRKPKTVIINGVEVAAPAKKDDIEQYFYTVNFSENIVHTIDKVYIDKGFKYYWATKEDAQKALDAMLIPFKQ